MRGFVGCVFFFFFNLENKSKDLSNVRKSVVMNTTRLQQLEGWREGEGGILKEEPEYVNWRERQERWVKQGLG